MTSISREKGREIVDDVRENNGGISQADRAKTPASVLRSLDSVRQKLGAATKTLATNLYTKDTRFVFELIQNAEDNDYTTEVAIRENPFLVFRLHPGSIVIDSNEDGFTEANVRAICSTGESTKSTSQGYIGEKGIGFKSVFKVASKVHIQSEPFSFFFEYTRGDGGLGMVTPVNENYYDLPSNIRTRMTLTLANPSEAERLATEFFDLPETLLLFLNKLRKITILRAQEPYPPSEVTYSKQEDPAQHRATLTKLSTYTRDGRESTQSTISTYQIKSRVLKKLPQHHARPNSNQAEVVLAFPLDSLSVPVIQQQYVFAFLPVRKAGFSFQIQCDFITGASREDIEKTARNEAILYGVAQTFRDAVLDFCHHPTLQFQWMRYLPGRNTIYDPFWTNLLPEIVRLLKETRVLRPWSGGSLKRPDQLKRVPDYFLDEAGKPLFKDVPDEVYLSSEYERSDFELLECLAVGELNFWDISTRIRADLDDPSSRWKSSNTREDWITRSASMLMRHLLDLGTKIGVKVLPIIPLQDRTWVSASSGSIFHPDSDGVPVPTDLALPLVDPQALKNFARKALFTKLGLQKCVPKDVIALILAKYNRSDVDVSLQASVSHLRYLYWHLPENERNLPKTIYLRDQNSQPIYRDYVKNRKKIIVDDLYLETDDIYEAKLLSVQVKLGTEVECPGFPLRYINRAYVNAVTSDVRRCDMSWEEWLGCSGGVRRTPRLVDRYNAADLTEFFRYIVRWRKDRLVGTLKAHWASYKKLLTRPVIPALCKAAVPCEDGTDVTLCTTYLPLPNLMKICKKMEVYRGMPMLKLPLEIDDDTKEDWTFLKVFDVGREANARFYLDVLRHFVRTHQSLSGVSRQILLKIYEAVEKYSKADDHESISKLFAGEDLIHVTGKESPVSLWTKPDQCLWNAPDFLTGWYSLSDQEGFRGNEKLKRLFKSVLDVQDADWTHYLQQLQAYKDQGLRQNDIRDIYHRLWREVEGENWRNVRQSFEENSLIFEPIRKEWYKPSSCLWTDDTRILGKVALLGHYADLQAFFVQRLGVDEPDIDTYITELQSLATDDRNPSIDKVKGLIRQINSFGPSVGALDKLTSSSVFPVQSPDATISLRSTLDLFVIADHPKYASAFKGKMSILDFDMEEVRELKLTIQALRLEDRYMSRLVVESSTVKESSKDDRSSRSIQKRAYALFRCASYYGSQSSRHRSLYDKLKATTVHQSDGICRKMNLTLKNIHLVVEGETGLVHIEEDDQQLRIYLPRKNKERSICYLTELPEKFAAQLCIHSDAAIRVLGDVLRNSSSILDDILDHHCVVRVSWIESAKQTDSEDSLSEEDTEQRAYHLAPSTTHPPLTPVRRGSSASIFSPASASVSTSHAARSFASNLFTPESSQTYRGYPNTPGSSLSPSPHRRREEASPGATTGGREYRALLDRVIRAASRAPFPRPGFPSPETGSDSDAETLVDLSDAVFGKRSDGKVSHDIKIGAAGELYAFEFLLKQLLPNFEQSNWRSTIRKEVCVHEKYRDLPAWNGRETADITYEDHETADPETAYKLTKLLRDYGYLPNDLLLEHEGASINYYLEVKTTTLACGTRLFVSKAQYERMHKMALQPGAPVRDIYVILRVFNLGQEDMGMRIYVDPASMERNGELKFQAETYTVVPAVEEEL